MSVSLSRGDPRHHPYGYDVLPTRTSHHAHVSIQGDALSTNDDRASDDAHPSRRLRYGVAVLQPQPIQDDARAPRQDGCEPTIFGLANNGARPIRPRRRGALVPHGSIQDDAHVPTLGRCGTTIRDRATDFSYPSRRSGPAGEHMRRRPDAAGATSPYPDAWQDNRDH